MDSWLYTIGTTGSFGKVTERLIGKGEMTMEIMVILSIVSAVMAIVRSGALTYVEVSAKLKEYENLPATPENIEKLRQELLTEAKMTAAVDDPRIRAILIADGIDPETLRIA